MDARDAIETIFPSQRQNTRKPIQVIGFIAVLVVAIALIFVEVRVYGTGFAGKTLWDWLQLLAALAIPVVVGFGAVWFTTRQGKVADAENKDNQREAALQAYIDKMSELLLEKHLRESQPNDEVRKIARVRTLTILPRLDANRKRSVLQFLYESGLIEKDNRIVDLSYADLSNANLWGFDLSGADLSKVKLREAALSNANLSGTNLHLATLTEADLLNANLNGANLEKAYLNWATLFLADLRGANLSEAILYEANLKGAKNITTEELEKQTKRLKGAIMPDGKIHP